MLAYPNDFKDAAMVIVDKLRGGAVSNPDAVHAAWCLTGFGLGQTLGGGPSVVGAGPVGDSDAALADYIETSLMANGAAGIAIPWSILVPLMLKLIERWLEK